MLSWSFMHQASINASIHMENWKATQETEGITKSAKYNYRRNYEYKTSKSQNVSLLLMFTINLFPFPPQRHEIQLHYWRLWEVLPKIVSSPPTSDWGQLLAVEYSQSFLWRCYPNLSWTLLPCNQIYGNIKPKLEHFSLCIT